MEYNVVYSNRKSIAVCIMTDGSVVVKCPRYASKKDIEEFVNANKELIEQTRTRILDNLKNKIVIDYEKKIELQEKALKVIDEKVKYYSKVMNVVPTKLVIGNAKSYWGYCDTKNGLNFSWRLMLASDEAIDYVVIHELAHIKQHNHSKEFWNEVEKIIPDYRKLKLELKELAKKLY